MLKSTLQSWVGAWKELKQWLFFKSDGPPSGIKEAGFYYDTATKKPMYNNGDINVKFGELDHEKLENKLGGDEINGYYHLKKDTATKVESYGQANGMVVSDSNNYIPISQIPISLLGAVRYQTTWDASTNTPTLALPPTASTKGYYYIVSVAGTFNSVSYNIGDWIISDGTAWQKIDNTDAVTSVAGRTGVVVLTKSDVGLGNVDNTSDANKPVSTATQTALNAKQPLDATLTALAGLDTTVGIVVQTGTDTFIKRAVQSGTGTTVTNSTGQSGNIAVNVTYEATATNIKMDGTQAVGTLNTAARGDHVHPSDTSRAPTSHAVSGTTYGVATSTNYGHVQIEDVVTDGSTKAVTSNAVFDALAGKAPLSSLPIGAGYAHYIKTLENSTSNWFFAGRVAFGKATGSNEVGTIVLRFVRSTGVGQNIDSYDRVRVSYSSFNGSVNYAVVGLDGTINLLRYSGYASGDSFFIDFTIYCQPVTAALGQIESSFVSAGSFGWNNTNTNLVWPVGENVIYTLAPTPSAGSNDTQVATTAWVQNAIGAFPRKFHYRYGSPDGVPLWTEIASFTPSVSTHYFFSLELTQAGNDFSWSNCPFSVHFSFYNTGTIDANSFRVSGRWLTNYTNSAGIRYGISGGVVKVYLYNWSNWVTAYAGTIIHDSHGVVNFSSSTTSNPTAYSYNNGIIKGNALDSETVQGLRLLYRAYNSDHSDSNTVYLEY